MRLKFCLILIVSLSGVCRAQTGKIGMTTAQMRAQLGDPVREQSDNGGVTWLYPGPDLTESFAYYFQDSSVVSTDVLITHPSPEAEQTRIDQVVATLTNSGWRDVRLSLFNHLLHAGDSVYRVYLINDPLPNAVMLSHMPRKLVKAINGRSRDILVAFHQSRASLDPELIAFVAGDSADTNAPPQRRPSGHAPAAPSNTTEPTAEDAPQTTADSVIPADGSKKSSRIENGYAWVVASEPERAIADDLAAWIRRQGLPVRVLPGRASGRLTYRVALGWYPNQKAMRAARDSLPAWVPDSSWPLTLAATSIMAATKTQAEEAPSTTASSSVSALPSTDANRSGYTLVIASISKLAIAETIVARCRERGASCQIYRGKSNGKKTYRIGMGWYPTARALNAARPSFPAWLPPDAWPLRTTREKTQSEQLP